MANQTAQTAGAPERAGLGRKLRGPLIGFAVLAGLLAVGCTQGSYPVDIFYEMHYQQSYKVQEPPSLSAPADSVAWFPPPESTAFQTGEHLYAVNCSMCHGATGQGDGPVVETLKAKYEYRPVVDPPIVTDNPVDNIVLILSSENRFFGPNSVMPPFRKLLSDEEILQIAEYIHTIPAPPPPAPPADEPDQPPPDVATDDGPVIGVNRDALEFDTDNIEVAAGDAVVFLFNNSSTLYQHNLVFVQAGQKDAVTERGAQFPDDGWLDPNDPDLIAASGLLDPGQVGEVRFIAPDAGTYQFVCTFPGHNVTMFGDFVVTP